MCLYWAIRKLSYREKGKYRVYSGLNGVQMDTKVVSSGYFVTYVSTSWRKEVSQAFMGKEKGGMMIQFDEEYRENKCVLCCDVSWISKFPDECEILFARSLKDDKGFNEFKCVVLDESNGIQTVSLSKSEL